MCRVVGAECTHDASATRLHPEKTRIADPVLVMKTIAIGIPSGQATRDVIHSGVLQQLLARPDVQVVVVTPAEAELKEFTAEFGNRVVVEPINYYRPSFVERFLRSVYWMSLYNKCGSIRDGIRRGKLRRLVWIVSLMQMCLGSSRFLGILDWINRRVGNSAQCQRILQAYQPSVVLLTRVFNFSADYQLLKEAYRQQIPTVALVSSWDNLTTKGFFPFGVDEILVWNEVMKQEAVELFDFPANKIHIVGVPRFDVYFRKTGMRDRDAFLRASGLDPAKRTITYTTANRGLMENPAIGITPELEIIKFLATHVEAGTFGVPTQLLVRLHPLAEPDDFRELFAVPNVCIQNPGRIASFGDRLFQRQEEQVLAETMCYSDVVMNVASTITIDAAIFDTPIICVDFDWFGPQPIAYSTKRFYVLDHYRKIASTRGYRTAKSRDDLLTAIREYLQAPARDHKGRAAIVRQQCHFSDGQSANRVADLLLQKLANVCELKAAA